MRSLPFRNIVKKMLMQRFDIARPELDRLICRHGMVALRTPPASLIDLIERVAPVRCEGRELIRLGAARDGGYLVPDDLTGIEACFSPGVAHESTFEEHCAQRGMHVFLADKSVDSPAVHHDRFHFEKKFLGSVTNADYLTLNEWVEQSVVSMDSDLLLQMDIEGAEYEVLLNMSDQLMRRFRIVVVEFHFLDDLWNSCFFAFASRAFEKLLVNHRCVHIHPNNCSIITNRDGLEIPEMMEFTFYRKDRITAFTPAVDFPHVLDTDCTTKPHLALPACWRGAAIGDFAMSPL